MNFILWFLIAFYIACSLGACVIFYNAIVMGCRLDDRMTP